MALNQLMPDFEPAVGLGAGAPVPLRRMRAPVKAGFRRGGSLEECIEQVRVNQAVAIDSAAGAGKSTAFPVALAKALGLPVLHVLPSVFLADELARYLTSIGSPVVFHEGGDLATAMRPAFVTITSAAAVQAYFLSTGKLELPECVLYQDETHRSDCFTFLLAQQWGTISGVKKYVSATATAQVSGFRPVETAGTISVHKYPAELRETAWSVFGATGKPWEVGAITGNTLIYEEDSTRALDLVGDYNRAGFTAFRLHSRMKLSAFRTAMLSLRDPAVTVLVADSSFRDGFTWPLATIVDTGRVGAVTVNFGGPVRAVRDAFAFEMYQGAARGGRVAGEKVSVWQPDIEFAARRMVLEEVEIEAVALISRMLSTLVPVDAFEAVMANGKVPRDLRAALVGSMPLSVLKDTQLVVLAAGGYERKPSPLLQTHPGLQRAGLDYDYPGVTADVANRRDFAPRATSPVFSEAASTLAASTAGTSVSSADDLVTWLSDALGRAATVQIGKYYHAPGIDATRLTCSAFPDGWRSVHRVVTSLTGLEQVSSMPDQVRTVAIAAALSHINVLSCETNAVARATADVRRLARDRSPVKLRDWLGRFMERSTALKTELRDVMPVLSALVHDFCTVEELPEGCLDEQEKNLADDIVASVRELPSYDSDGTSMLETVRGLVTRQAPPAYVDDGPGLVKDPGRFLGMPRRGSTARPVGTPVGTALSRWVVGYDHNQHVRHAYDKKYGPRPGHTALPSVPGFASGRTPVGLGGWNTIHGRDKGIPPPGD